MQMMITLVVALAAVMLPDPSVQQCFSPDDTKVQSSPNTLQDLFTGERAFSLDMLREVVAANPTGNVFFSPYSVYNALLLAYFGAGNHTELSLKAVLRIPQSQVSLYYLHGGVAEIKGTVLRIRITLCSLNAGRYDYIKFYPKSQINAQKMKCVVVVHVMPRRSLPLERHIQIGIGDYSLIACAQTNETALYVLCYFEFRARARYCHFGLIS
jgi:hypothetical protein